MHAAETFFFLPLPLSPAFLKIMCQAFFFFLISGAAGKEIYFLNPAVIMCSGATGCTGSILICRKLQESICLLCRNIIQVRDLWVCLYFLSIWKCAHPLPLAGFIELTQNISFVFDLIYVQLSASRNIKMTPDHPFLLNYKNHANIFIAASLTAAHKILVISL